jgi:hypothetical protein
MCYGLLCPTPSKPQELHFVHSRCAHIPSYIDVLLRISVCESLMVIRLAPIPGAHGGHMSLFDVKPTGVTHIEVRKHLCGVREWCGNGTCLWYQCCWCLWNECTTSASTSSLLSLLIMCKWRLFVLTSTTSIATPASATSSLPTSAICSRLEAFSRRICEWLHGGYSELLYRRLIRRYILLGG